ncbi:hypothetical protein FE782_01930 [Paenibacillus antri]|uniref:ATP-binding protein n=1 Tax=Paenibacillus antri TaxID=2582848 RepID=A0A5R9GG16_9BACL|nr:ATP-binding protein [Paenibacillus antri]TLS54129.1 hypothetical protein FE782_01930 [Paenibacillus antri]
MSTFETDLKPAHSNLRFGGISPVVLRELSGVYQPFVKAVKEMVSNAYDADADSVHLDFIENYRLLTISDDGCGMDPIEFVRDYIRIGKSSQKDEYTSRKQRPRIGGKGIGFLAPARYCDEVEVRTKKGSISQHVFHWEANGQRRLDLGVIVPGGLGRELLERIEVISITNENGEPVAFDIQEHGVVTTQKSLNYAQVAYTLRASEIELVATINFKALFSLESNRSLEDIDNFCTTTIRVVEPSEQQGSYTRITLKELKDFVVRDLSKPAKKRARNIESFGGDEQFLWNLSRIIPIKANLHNNIPEGVRDFIRAEMDGENLDYPITISYSINGGLTENLHRKVIEPERQLDENTDADLIKILRFTNDDFEAKGFLIGQSTTIFPAECRGILIRVKGVAIGDPTFLGLDQLLTGSSKVALSQISGEINITKGIDAIHDINPGRDGFYKESKQYNRLKQLLIGDNPERLEGPLKQLIDAIINRSDINASMTNFIKRHEAQRNAIIEASAGIMELSFEDPEVMDHFYKGSLTYELQLAPAAPFKAEGKLASFTVSVEEEVTGDYQIDYVSKTLKLNKRADIWKRNISIGGEDFEIIYKQGKHVKAFCEVNPSQNKIYLNWDHPIRSTMGDAGFIKHCLATVASNLPQDQMEVYIKLVTNKI